MRYEEAKDYVRQRLTSYLEGKGINTRTPFICLNPDHPDTKPSMSYDPKRNKCHCFSCNADYDTFDLIAIDYNTSGGDTFKRAFELYGLNVEYDRTTAASDFKGVGHSKPPQLQPPPPETIRRTPENNIHIAPQKPAPDSRTLTTAIEQAHAALMNNTAALAYLQGRGLTLDTIRRHKIGYSAGGQNALLQGYNEQFQSKSHKAGLYKYIFPVLDNKGNCYYYVSEISDRSQIDEYNGKYMKLKNAAQRFFNESFIAYNSGIIFVCEGVYDALSIEQAGGRAIALTGTGGNSRILELESRPNTDNAYIIALDSDKAGQKAAQSLKRDLVKAGRTCIISPLEGAKDANELLQNNPAALAQYVQRATAAAAARKAEFDTTRGIVERLLTERDIEAAAGELAEKVIDRQQEAADYPKTTAAAQLQGFIDHIQQSERVPYFSTGFNELNTVLDGGIYPGGLYFIGAISSLGKTTLTLQIADNIAAAGQDVLIFSLEMDKYELMAKSISRHTLIEDMKQYQSTEHAKSTRGILTGSRYKYYSDEEKKIIAAAIESYNKYADHIRISVGVGTIGVEQIAETVEKHIRITGNRPVIVIDYLQILAPADPRATDKQNTDNAVLELKRLARDKDIPVIGISSFNRDNYTAPVNMASFKESGAVEYSADVLIAMQYLGMDYAESESKDAREKRIRELINTAINNAKEGKAQQIQVKVLKNRNGSKGQALLDYYPMYNYFCDNNQTTAERETAARTPGKPARQKELETLLTAFREVESPAESNTASLEALADKLDYKKSTLKGKLKEFTKLFTVKGDIVTYHPETATDQTDTDTPPF